MKKLKEMNQLKDIALISKDGKVEPIMNFTYPSGPSGADDGEDDFLFELLLMGLVHDLAGKMAIADAIYNSPEEMKSRVCYMLVNKDSVTDDVPTRKVFDMNLVYMIPLKQESESVFSIVKVTNNLAERLNLTEEELYEIAKINTPKLLPIDVRELDGSIEDVKEEFGEDSVQNIYAYSNNIIFCGAVTVFYKDAFKDIEDEGYIIILPCSINGMFVLTMKELDKELIEKIYNYIKKESKNDILLSDSILIWNKENKTIEAL